jgi:cellulose synthase/poly-beta-1,6-N-acetylglucosamine synthase-like glycosyltransferase
MSLTEIIFFSTFFTLWAVFLFYFTLMLHFSRRPTKVNKRPIFPSVSMIITTFNEEMVIGKKLSNTVELEYPEDKLGILIVDSGSTDKTREIVENFVQRFKTKVNIHLLTQKERLGKAVALNYALKYCKGDIVILSDADVLLDKDVISKITSNFNDEKIGAVSGIEVIRNPDQSSTTKMERGYRSFYNTVRLGETNLDSVVMCESEFAAYRRELMEEIPQDSVCDDMELTLRVRKKGFRAIYDPTVVFYEYSPIKYKSRLKHKIRRGQGNQQTLLGFADMMFRLKYGVFSFVILPFEFFMHIISPFLTPICIATYIIMAISSFNTLLVFFPITLLILTVCLIFFFLKVVSPATSITLEYSANSGSPKMLSIVFDFIALQLCLLISLFSLAFGSPKYKWQKIEEIRDVQAVKQQAKLQ